MLCCTQYRSLLIQWNVTHCIASLLFQIGDMGLSKVRQHTLVSGGVRGTLPWMAPELLSGKSNMVTEKVNYQKKNLITAPDYAFRSYLHLSVIYVSVLPG